MPSFDDGVVGPADGLDFGEEAMDEMEREFGVPESVLREEMMASPLGGVLTERHQRSFLVEVHIGTIQPSHIADLLGDYLPEPTPCGWSPTNPVLGELSESEPGIVRLFWDGDLEFWPVWEHLEILGWAAPFGMSASGSHLGSRGFSVYLLVRLKEDAEIPDGGLDELMDDALQALQVTWQLGRYLLTLTYWEDYGWEDITATGLPGGVERVSGLECFY